MLRMNKNSKNRLPPPVVAALPRSSRSLPTQPSPRHFNRTVPFSNYRVLECDLKGCIASTGVIDVMKPFRSQSRTLYMESTAFTFWTANAMVAV